MPPSSCASARLKKARSASVWDAVLTVRTVLLTWGDTVSDMFALAILLRDGSYYAMPMLVALIIATKDGGEMLCTCTSPTPYGPVTCSA